MAHGMASYNWYLTVPRRDDNHQDQQHQVTLATLLDLCIIPIVTPSQRLGGRLAESPEGGRLAQPNWLHGDCMESTHTNA